MGRGCCGWSSDRANIIEIRNRSSMDVFLLQSGEEEIDLGKNPKPLVFVIHTFLSAKVQK